MLAAFVFCLVAMSMSCLGQQQLEEYDLDDMNDFAGDKFKKCCDDSGMNCPEGMAIHFYYKNEVFIYKIQNIRFIEIDKLFK
jgi:hypothetical protein